MRKRAIIFLAETATLTALFSIVCYFAAAFIQADLYWMRGVMEWTQLSRGALLLAEAFCVGLAVVITIPT